MSTYLSFEWSHEVKIYWPSQWAPGKCRSPSEKSNDDAHTLIVSTTQDMAITSKSVIAVANDTDVLVWC